MRIIKQSAREFVGTHKGHRIEIEREPEGTFYIIVTGPDGTHAYDGWAPRSVETMAEAKREARKGAMI